MIGTILICVNSLKANPVVPTFRTGSSSTNSTSQSVVTENITSFQYRTGYTYSSSGTNIESADINGYINSVPSAETSQTVNGINFSYTSPNTITQINRTINTTTTTTVETTFGQ